MKSVSKGKYILLPIILFAICSCSSLNKVDGKTFISKYYAAYNKVNVKQYKKLKLKGTLNSFGQVYNSTDESFYDVTWVDGEARLDFSGTDQFAFFIHGEISDACQLTPTLASHFENLANDESEDIKVNLYAGSGFMAEYLSNYNGCKYETKQWWNKDQLLLTKFNSFEEVNGIQKTLDVECFWIE